MTRYVLLPEEIRTDLHSLTLEKGEMRGMIVYREVKDGSDTICPLEKLVVLNRGTSSSVKMDGRNSQLFQNFLSSTDYSFLDCHTHTIGSMEIYGSQVAEQFSQGDLKGIQKTQRVNPQYMHLLATPRKIILHGLDNPQLVLVSDAQIREIVKDYEQSQGFIEQEVLRLIQEGY